MVVTLVIGNHWRGQHIWGEVEDPARQKKKSEKTSAPIGAFSDEEFGKGSATASATSESKGYVIVKGQMDTHHRRSMTMNDAGNVQNSFIKAEPDKLSLTLPEEESDNILLPMTNAEKIDNINEFFEDLFKSIDYSILLIFMGTSNVLLKLFIILVEI